MKELIYTWLKNKDYTLGVELYRRYGSNAYLKRLFAQGEDHYNATKLEQELQALLDTDTTENVMAFVSPSVVEDSPPTRKSLPLDEPDAPAEIKEAIARRKILYARARSNHDRLYQVYKSDSRITVSPSVDEDTARLALEILDAWDQIADLWKLTNFYDQHRRLPRVSPSVAEDSRAETRYDTWPTDQLQKRWNANYKYIRKFQANTSKTEQLTARHAECQQIETILRSRDAFIYDNLQLPSL